jgi:site-specific recombinase XerD
MRVPAPERSGLSGQTSGRHPLLVQVPARGGLVGRNPAEEIHLPRIRFAEPDYLQPHEYGALLEAAEKNGNPFLGLRNKALLSTLLGTGARVSEVIHIDLKHLDLAGSRIRLHRKGGEVQGLPLSEELVGIMCPYLKQRRKRTHCRAVFVSIRGHRLTQQAVWNVVHDCASRARLLSKRISPHTLRHSFASTLLSNGENLQTIRILMNHKNLSTTARYLHTRDKQLSAAVNGISLNSPSQKE